MSKNCTTYKKLIYFSYDEDSKMTTTDSCSYNTPGSLNGWHSPVEVSTSFHNGAISKNNSYYHNGYQEKVNCNHRSEKDEDRLSRSPKNINLANGVKNINLSNGVIKKKNKETYNEKEMMNGLDRKSGYQTLTMFRCSDVCTFHDICFQVLIQAQHTITMIVHQKIIS